MNNLLIQANNNDKSCLEKEIHSKKYDVTENRRRIGGETEIINLKNINHTISFIFSFISRTMFLPLSLCSAILAGCIFLKPTEDSLHSEPSSLKYTVREYNGQVAVFRDENTVPDRILDVYVITLPESDAERLKDGITAEGNDAIRSLVEDFSG